MINDQKIDYKDVVSGVLLLSYSCKTTESQLAANQHSAKSVIVLVSNQVSYQQMFEQVKKEDPSAIVEPVELTGNKPDDSILALVEASKAEELNLAANSDGKHDQPLLDKDIGYIVGALAVTAVGGVVAWKILSKPAPSRTPIPSQIPSAFPINPKHGPNLSKNGASAFKISTLPPIPPKYG